MVQTKIIEHNKQLVLELFEAVDTSDWSIFNEVFDLNVVYERPGYQPFISLDRLLKFYREERIIASGKHYLDQIAIEENKGACWGRFMGWGKDGSLLDEGFADVYLFENGKIKKRKSYFFRPAV